MSTPQPVNGVLQDLRCSIDNIDAAFLFLLAERTRVIAKIGALKKLANLPFTYSEEREQDLQQIVATAIAHNLHEAFIAKLFQRIYVEALRLMQRIELSNNQSKTNLFFSKQGLDSLRQSLVNLDSSLCYTLAERFTIVRRVGLFKAEHGIKPLAATRWQQVLESKSEMASELGVSTPFVQDIFNMIHEEALRIEAQK